MHNMQSSCVLSFQKCTKPKYDNGQWKQLNLKCGMKYGSKVFYAPHQVVFQKHRGGSLQNQFLTGQNHSCFVTILDYITFIKTKQIHCRSQNIRQLLDWFYFPLSYSVLLDMLHVVWCDALPTWACKWLWRHPLWIRLPVVLPVVLEVRTGDDSGVLLADRLLFL